MKTRPKELTFLATLLALLAVSMPLQIMYRYGDAPWELGAIAAKLAPLNWAVIALAILEARLLSLASRGVWIIAPLFLAAVLWNNWLVFSVGGGEWDELAWFASAIVVTLQALILKPAARQALNRPDLRWWRTPVRRNISVPARIFPVHGGELRSHTINISRTGILVAVGEQIPKHLKVGSYCSIQFKFDQFHCFRCSAEVVRAAPAQGQQCFGLHFIGLTPSEKRSLEGVMRALPA